MATELNPFSWGRKSAIVYGWHHVRSVQFSYTIKGWIKNVLDGNWILSLFILFSNEIIDKYESKMDSSVLISFLLQIFKGLNRFLELCCFIYKPVISDVKEFDGIFFKFASNMLSVGFESHNKWNAWFLRNKIESILKCFRWVVS